MGARLAFGNDREIRIQALARTRDSSERSRRATSRWSWLRARSCRASRYGTIEVCLPLPDEAGDRFERAVMRWLGRFALEARGVTIGAIQTAAAAPDAMPAHPERSMQTLAGLYAEHGVTA